MFELHMINNVANLQIFFKQNAKIVQINIPNCGLSCPLDKMYKLYKNVLPMYDYRTECNVKV